MKFVEYNSNLFVVVLSFLKNLLMYSLGKSVEHAINGRKAEFFLRKKKNQLTQGLLSRIRIHELHFVELPKLTQVASSFLFQHLFSFLFCCFT